MIRSSNKTILKQILSIYTILFIVTSLFIGTNSALAATVDPCAPDARGYVPVGCTYVPLTTIPGLTTGCVPDIHGDTSSCVKANPVKVLSNVYGVAIGIAAILAIGMIIWAGIQYATTEAITGKSAAKEHWHGALWGLLLLLSAFLILQTINVQLVNVDLSLGTPVECSVLDKDGKKVPCQLLSSDPLKVAIEDLRNKISVKNRELNSLNDTATAAQKALDAAIAAGATDDVINELQDKRDAAIQAKANAEYAQIKLYSYTSAAELSNVYATNADTFSTDQIRANINKLAVDSAKLISSMRDQKTNSGSNVFSNEEIITIENQLAQQMTYLEKMLAWRNGTKTTMSGTYTPITTETVAKPVRPVFTFPSN